MSGICEFLCRGLQSTNGLGVLRVVDDFLFEDPSPRKGFVLQGSLNGTHIGGTKQCKSMVILGGFALQYAVFGLVI